MDNIYNVITSVDIKYIKLYLRFKYVLYCFV